MNQQKIGCFLKELRKEKALTQEELAEQFNISTRSVSRWETGRHMPDLDILIELADFYHVDVKELLDGERKDQMMNNDTKETVLKVADYSHDEILKVTKKLHIFFWIGIIAFLLNIFLGDIYTSHNYILNAFSDFCGGLALGILIIGAIYTSQYMKHIQNFKKRLFHR